MRDQTSWKEQFSYIEHAGPIIAWAAHWKGETVTGKGEPTGEWWTALFDASWGSTHGDPFTIWTEDRVYFPGNYDGSEWVASVPRHPCNEYTDHVGGG